MTGAPENRRPLASRDTAWAHRAANWLVARDVHPNQISQLARVFAGLGFLAFALSGIVLGTYLARFIPGAKLKPAFGWFTLAMGTFILTKELLFHHS